MSVIQDAEMSKWSERIVVICPMIQIIIFVLFCALVLLWHLFPPSLALWETARTSFIEKRICGGSTVRACSSWCAPSSGSLNTVKATLDTLSHEWTLYVFDRVLMFAAAGIFCWRFSGHLGSRARKDDGYKLGKGRYY